MILNLNDSFVDIKDIMNNVFKWNYKAYYRGFYYLDDDKKVGAWFPKLSKDCKTPGDAWYGWVNTISADGKYIYMKNYCEPSRMEKGEDEFKTIHITFTKLPGEHYKYSGCYIRTHLDPELGWICERVSEKIDTDSFHLVPKKANQKS